VLDIGQRGAAVKAGAEPIPSRRVIENKPATKGCAMTDHIDNPKLADNPDDNAEKDPENWTTGDEPMTGAQKSYLNTLCEEAKVELPEKGMTKAEASIRIDELKSQLNK
jgi:hypothetical protein